MNCSGVMGTATMIKEVFSSIMKILTVKLATGEARRANVIYFLS